MRKGFDSFDLKILEGLGTHGPRNLLALARKLKIPEATLRRRLKQMRSEVFLQSNVYHTNIGLRKVIVFAKAFQGYENLLYKCMDVHDYLIYISRSYGEYEGCVAIFAIPLERCCDFERFLEYLESEGVAKKIQYYWSTCFQTVNLKCDWYDESSENWFFFWNEWVQEVLNEGTELPFTLVDPLDYPLLGDAIDIFILKELEIDATISLKALATKLNTSVPLIKYHYDRHIVGQRLLEGFQVIYYPFDKAKSNGFFFTFMFDRLEKMAKFASSLLDKPFVFSIGKIFGAPSLFVNIYLPTVEFRRFVDNLGKLVRNGFLRKYKYVLQDIGATQRYTIPYKSFRNKSWIYDHKEYLRKVKALIDEEKALWLEKKSIQLLSYEKAAPHN